MTKEEKQATLDDLKVVFSKTENFYITDTSGLTVADVNKLRRQCFKAGIKLRVAKNTLIRKALEANGVENAELVAALNGPTAIMFSEVANAPAKVIKDFRKSSEKP